MAIIVSYDGWGFALCETWDGWLHVVGLEAIEAVRAEVEVQLDAGALPAVASDGNSYLSYDELDFWCARKLEECADNGLTGLLNGDGDHQMNPEVVRRRLASAALILSGTYDFEVTNINGQTQSTPEQIIGWFGEIEAIA
jgi:hypothetical protein